MSLKDAVKNKSDRRKDDKEKAVKEITKEPLHRLNVQITKRKFNQFKAKASLNGHQLTQLINQWIDGYLSK